MNKPKRRILIVEGAVSVARQHEQALGPSYDLVLCADSEQVQRRINARELFDIVIMAMVLPPDIVERPRLADFQNAGLYLLEQLLEHRLCWRFYVVTIRKQAKAVVRDLCRKHGAICRFRHKLMYQPSQLVNEIEWLWNASPDDYGTQCTLTGIRLAAQETMDHLKLCRRLSTLPRPLGAADLASFGAAMTWLFEALDYPSLHAFHSQRVFDRPGRESGLDELAEGSTRHETVA